MRLNKVAVLSFIFFSFFSTTPKGFGQNGDSSLNLTGKVRKPVITNDAAVTNAQLLDGIQKQSRLLLNDHKHTHDSIIQLETLKYIQQKEELSRQLEEKDVIAAELRSGNENIESENLVMTTNVIIFFVVLISTAVLILSNRYRSLLKSRSRLQKTKEVLSAMEKGVENMPEITQKLETIHNNFVTCEEELRKASPLFSSIIADKNHPLFKTAKSLISDTETVRMMLQNRLSQPNEVKILTNLNILINETVQQAYFSVKTQWPEFNCKVVHDLEKILPDVEVFPEEIRFVIFNLLENAFYAVWKKRNNSPKGYEPTVTISSRKLPRFVQIRVKDNGTGIDSKIEQRVFEPFFTTRRDELSSGLGLSESHKIISARHKGELYIESDLTNSTDFIIRFPLNTIM